MSRAALVLCLVCVPVRAQADDDETAPWRALGYAMHVHLVAEVPIEVGVHAWFAAREQRIDPYDLAAAVVSENSWRYSDMSLAASLSRDLDEIDYEADAVGAAGERGMAQVAPYWANKARTRCEEEGWGECEELVEDGLSDPRINMRVAAFVVRAAQESHAEHALSYDDIRKCKRKWRQYDRGEIRHVPGCQLVDHGWGAHYKLGREDRDILCGQPGFQKRKLRRVRASLTSIVRPTEVWEETLKEHHRYCGGES